jgi:CDP-diacylglycerol pyrophosphatase
LKPQEQVLKSFTARGIQTLTLAVALTIALSTSASAAAAPAKRDILWDIVSNCLDTSATDYCNKCRWPRPETSCAATLVCKQTTQVWAETEEYVVLRDRKMCGCPDGFVHGLAIPRSRVTGVEDQRHPEGIWPFAWDIALHRIQDPREAALAVNPAGLRAQDQLHVHIVRLKKGARQNFCSNYMTRVPSLDHVWAVASKLAASTWLYDYGILVTSHPEGGFIVLVDRKSPEKEYVQEGCSESDK